MTDQRSLAALIADLEHPEKPVIRAAADALCRAAAESAAVTATLAGLLADHRRTNRWAVAYVLGQLPSPADAVIQTLLEGLDHREADIRWAIALLLSRLAKGNRCIADAIVRLSRQGTPTQRRLAVYCIRDMNLHDADSRRALVMALTDEDAHVRIAAAGSLRRTADLDDGDHGALLQSFFQDPDVRVRGVAAMTLAQRGYATEQFCRALEEECSSEDQIIGKAARAALELLKNKRAAPSGV